MATVEPGTGAVGIQILDTPDTIRQSMALPMGSAMQSVRPRFHVVSRQSEGQNVKNDARVIIDRGCKDTANTYRPFSRPLGEGGNALADTGHTPSASKIPEYRRLESPPALIWERSPRS